jgi:hypothetical protein
MEIDPFFAQRDGNLPSRSSRKAPLEENEMVE